MAEIKRGLEIARKILTEGRHDLIVLDEILTLVSSGVLDEAEVEEVTRMAKPDSELIFTGRYKGRKLLEKADLVTEMKMIKHYFDKGEKARKGIEY